MRGGLNIAAKTRKLDVDNRLSLKLYYRLADNLVKQASIYRAENNVIDLYILLLRFSSLVTETIPEHRDYRTSAGKERADFKRKSLEVLIELEALKPEVQKLVGQINSSYLGPSPFGDLVLGSSHAWPSVPNRPVRNGKELLALGQEVRGEIPSNLHDSVRSPKHLVEDHLTNLSLSIPRPKDETLSRHSFLGIPAQRGQRDTHIVPIRVQYPSYVDASPIEMPSLDQNWRIPSQIIGVSSSSNLVDTGTDSVSWLDADTRPSSDNVAPSVHLIRQPSPPPIAAPVQTLPVPVDSLSHVYDQPMPADVADPRPGPPQSLEDEFGQSKGSKHLHISPKMMEEFMTLARLNTLKNLETCGVLAGSLKTGVFYVTALIIPKQEATSDSCQTVNEEEIFETQDKRGLFQLGWIHTHPSQSCFMSSIDLHTHYSYQIMLQEAVAIVMAPTDPSRSYGIFRLSDPGGVKVIQQCQKRGFHPHEEPLDGGPIYEHCSHVLMNPQLRFDVLDLRLQS